MNGAHTPVSDEDLQAFIDGRLEGSRFADVEAYLTQHPDIEKQVIADRRYRDSLRAQLDAKFAEPIPPRLRLANLRSVRSLRTADRLRAAAAALVFLTMGAAGGWLITRAQFKTGVNPSSQTTMTIAHDAAAAYRTFVVEVAHPVEVDAAHEGHLLQWLSKRLGRPLQAPDLVKFGYHLMGGRLLPGGDGAAAQLMYDDTSGKRLTVYVTAGDATETAFRFKQDKDAASFAWIDQGFGFAVTAMADRNELLPIAEAVYSTFESNALHVQ